MTRRASMELTIRKGVQGLDPRLSAARDYLLRILECVAQAGTLFRVAAAEHLISEPLDRAARLVENGLRLIESSCGENLPAGLAEGVIDEIAALKVLMTASPEGERVWYKDLPEVAVELFREHILLLMRSMPPEQSVPEFVSADDGLRVSESRACPVTLSGGENDKRRAFVYGKPVEPPLTPGMYRALAKMRRALLSGDVGIPRKPLDENDCREVLGADQGDLSRLLNGEGHDPVWAQIIFTPQTRGPRGGAKLYGINPS
jgi:hypothetical protein